MKRLTLMLFALCWIAGCASVKDPIDVTTLEELPPNPYIYRITPGDVVRVEIAEDDGYDFRSTVLPDGSATFRWAGHLDVMGLTLVECKDLLRDKLQPWYTNPTMTLYLERVNGPDPIVWLGNFGGGGTGALGQQKSNGGVIAYRKGIGVMEALALAGGPGEPDYNLVPYLYVIRNIKTIKDRKVYRIDLAEAVTGNSPDLPLHPGDVMFLDQSWLQDLERALGITFRIVGAGMQGLGNALVIDAVADGAFTK
ncbi:MAG: polysaccharide biosynthesis/export family protein [Planctomycetes bacterium]|nr:polysaccharide biosynthesis/export family protein [Planctomycetota bacterium]MCW8135576.1 polysaccharide biosynthesis/export family protein [Planctomycetota bacterium]